MNPIKALRNGFLYSVLLSAQCAIEAQTLTASCNPALFNSYFFTEGVYINPGQGGQNRNWGFVPIPLRAFSVVCTFNHSTGLDELSGKAATVLLDDKYAAAVDPTSSGLTCWGERFFSAFPATKKIYSNPEELVIYPFSFGNSFADQWVNTYTINSIPHRETGSSTVTVDGTGTLDVGTRHYSNVLRVHRLRHYRDSVLTGTQPTTVNTSESHIWYQPGIELEILAISSFSSNASQPINTLKFRTSQTTGYEETEFSHAMIYPNPAKDAVHFVLSEACNECSVVLTDISGGERLRYRASGNHAILSLNGIPPGIYLLQIVTDDGTTIRKKLTISG